MNERFLVAWNRELKQSVRALRSLDQFPFYGEKRDREDKVKRTVFLLVRGNPNSLEDNHLESTSCTNHRRTQSARMKQEP